MTSSPVRPTCRHALNRVAPEGVSRPMPAPEAASRAVTCPLQRAVAARSAGVQPGVGAPTTNAVQDHIPAFAPGRRRRRAIRRPMLAEFTTARSTKPSAAMLPTTASHSAPGCVSYRTDGCAATGGSLQRTQAQAQYLNRLRKGPGDLGHVDRHNNAVSGRRTEQRTRHARICAITREGNPERLHPSSTARSFAARPPGSTRIGA